MLKLVNVKETYEVPYGKEEEGQTKFVLRKLSASEVNSIDDKITISKGDDSFSYLGGTASKMKIRIAVVDWVNVEGDDGKPADCNDRNKEHLPADVQQYLVKRIDEDNGLIRTKKKEQEEKN